MPRQSWPPMWTAGRTPSWTPGAGWRAPWCRARRRRPTARSSSPWSSFAPSSPSRLLAGSRGICRIDRLKLSLKVWHDVLLCHHYLQVLGSSSYQRGNSLSSKSYLFSEFRRQKYESYLKQASLRNSLTAISEYPGTHTEAQDPHTDYHTIFDFSSLLHLTIYNLPTRRQSLSGTYSLHLWCDEWTQDLRYKAKELMSFLSSKNILVCDSKSTTNILESGWQKLREDAKGLRQKVWTQTKNFEP